MLRVRGVSKRFGALQALADADLDAHAGEIHAVLGENGAGKSTLMHIVYGLLQPDAGWIAVDGAPRRFRSPTDARGAGIGMVHQEFALVDALSVTENLALSLSAPGTCRLNHRRVAAAASRLANDVGLDIGDPAAPVGALPVGIRQRVEILKALAGAARLLILDEPTAVLTPAEATQLFQVLDRLRARGTAIIFITHKLREALGISDRVTVLRRGRVVATARAADLTESQLAELMIGTTLPTSERRECEASPGEARLRLDALTVADNCGRIALHNLSLTVGPGEILAIAGVDGNGQLECFEALAGLRPPRGGTVAVDGQAITDHDPAGRLAAGLAFVPPDRGRQGLIRSMSVEDNVALSGSLRRRASQGPFLRPARLRAITTELLARYAIQSAGPHALAGSLSGGHQQRLVVARALAAQPKVLIAFNPTRGLDIAAAVAVFDAIDAALKQGTAVLLISTDLDEVLERSHRVIVLFRGRASAPLSRPFSLQDLGHLMTGGDTPATSETA